MITGVANVYSDSTSEEIVGRALADFAVRDGIVIATKLKFRMRPRGDRGVPPAQIDLTDDKPICSKCHGCVTPWPVSPDCPTSPHRTGVT